MVLLRDSTSFFILRSGFSNISISGELTFLLLLIYLNTLISSISMGSVMFLDAQVMKPKINAAPVIIMITRLIRVLYTISRDICVRSISTPRIA